VQRKKLNFLGGEPSQCRDEGTLRPGTKTIFVLPSTKLEDCKVKIGAN